MAIDGFEVEDDMVRILFRVERRLITGTMWLRIALSLDAMLGLSVATSEYACCSSSRIYTAAQCHREGRTPIAGPMPGKHTADEGEIRELETAYRVVCKPRRGSQV